MSSMEGLAPSRIESLSKELGGASFADIEEFAVSVQRRTILAGPNAALGAIVRNSIQEWKERAKAQVGTSR